MNRVLFVDDEPNVLEGLGRALRSMRDTWDISFANSGAEALELMENDGAFDVICTDMLMPGMMGDELLATVMERYPDTVRLVLSGQLHTPAIVTAGSIAHQIL
ncbi:MAG: response regulator [Candidatus Hydrogenedentota bacterium]|jgi:CheY-like chemotaxis protein